MLSRHACAGEAPPGEDTPMGASIPAISIERAAELSGSSRKSIERAKPIVQSGIQELQDMVDSGEVQSLLNR
jgi:hypothetical protein